MARPGTARVSQSLSWSRAHAWSRSGADSTFFAEHGVLAHGVVDVESVRRRQIYIAASVTSQMIATEGSARTTPATSSARASLRARTPPALTWGAGRTSAFGEGG